MARPVANAVPLLVSRNNHNGTLEEEFISGLVQGGAWTFGGGPRTLTYSFDLNFDGPVESFTEGWMEAIDKAFQAWANVANIRFSGFGSPNAVTQNLSQADIAIALSPEGRDGLAGIGIFPDPDVADLILDTLGYSRTGGLFPAPRLEGDITFNSNHFIFDNLAAGGRGFYVMLHEIGHALGLKHTDDDGINGRPTFKRLGIAEYDNPQYTLMEGKDFPLGKVPSTPMLLDILAIQHIYGANMTYHAGNNIYRLTNGSYQAIWDAGGRDTLVASSASVINLNEGTFSGAFDGARTTGIAYNVTIENATGSARGDRLIGNDRANVLIGLGGNDTMIGGAGADTLRGGAGDDLYMVNRASTLIIEESGRDTIRAKFDYTLGAGLENLDYEEAGRVDLTGTGNALANRMVGSDGECVLDGRGGNDTLQGGSENDTLVGGRGFDIFFGGTGIDTYVVDRMDEVAALREHYDRFEQDILVLDSPTDVQWEIGLNQRYLRGISTVTVAGKGTADVKGYVGNDTLVGHDGNDSLFGAGGRDSLIGGGGDDRLNGGSDFDVLDGGDGNDVLIGGASSQDGSSIEITGDTLYGGAGDDRLTGGDGDDRLDGGDGLDTMAGGEGDDTYVLDRLDEVALLLELAGGGSDTVLLDLAEGSHVVSLEGLPEIERIFASGNGDYTLTGNGLGNRLSGGLGDDRLPGLGGDDELSGGDGDDTLEGGEGNDTLLAGEAGADSLVGGAGDDTYLFLNSVELDVIVETAGEGLDRIVFTWTESAPGLLDLSGLQSGIEVIDARPSTRSFTIIGSDFGETLISGDLYLLGGSGIMSRISGGGGDDSIVGWGGDSVLTGDEGADTLVGGDWFDTLQGGAGNDYLFDDSGVDVLDGGVGDDTLVSAQFGDSLSGGDGNDVLQSTGSDSRLWGGEGNDTLTGSFCKLLDGGDGDDILETTGCDSIFGGAGTDLVVFQLGSAFLAWWSGIEIIDIGAGKNFSISAAQVVALSDTDELRFDGASGTLSIGDGWASGADQVIGDQTYKVYTQDIATLLVEDGLTVV